MGRLVGDHAARHFPRLSRTMGHRFSALFRSRQAGLRTPAAVKCGRPASWRLCSTKTVGKAQCCTSARSPPPAMVHSAYELQLAAAAVFPLLAYKVAAIAY